ncbi:hypothetical protein ANN_09509 [Periplaneta americana]|uniref:Uncharacterized protein n=1 Tax=Periplaneta americana TaxID=6978 RepID=A0ABQ8TN90_PERAM|nr:hypothetical protein ANN_09509 [Periplaneta americana]
MLHRFYNILAEIDSFLKKHNTAILEISDSEWIMDLAFLTDLCDHLNCLSNVLQGKSHCIVVIADAIKSFMDKLKLWLHQLQKPELYHCPRLQSLVNQKVHVITKYQPILEMLFSEFETRFHDINDMNVEMLIFENPFAVKSEAPLN